MTKRIGGVAVALVGLLAPACLAGCGDESADTTCASWHQWGNSAAHDGATCASGQRLQRSLADVVYDSFTREEAADEDGELLVHYQVPLIDGDDVYILSKQGTYTPCAPGPLGPDCASSDPYRRNSQVWTEKAYRWDSDTLTERWSFASDWKPEPGVDFEPMFQPALAGDLIAIPGAGGTVFEVDRNTGDLVRRVMPLGATIDPDTYVAGPVAVTDDATLYYNTIAVDHDRPFEVDARGRLVVVASDGNARTVEYATLISGAPAADAPCETQFDAGTTPRPWPPPSLPDGTLVVPPAAPCGSQRPGINSAPAIAADGRVFVVTRAHLNARYAYVVALDADLSVAWAASLRDLLDDGCGVTVPIDGTDTEHFDHCRVGATPGFDPATNAAPAAMVDDHSSSSPVALPDGGVLYGAFTRYNGTRGHLLRFDPNGGLTGVYDFGWDTTPAAIPDGDDVRIVVKNNHYGKDDMDVDLGPFQIVELDGALQPLWTFTNTETRDCIRGLDGSIACVEDHPNGFEWCIDAPAVDRDGVIYANAEDGYVYAITADGALRDRFFLDRSQGAAYTPVALDHAGRVFAMNNGHLVVVGAN